jgi:thymidylate kinase
VSGTLIYLGGLDGSGKSTQAVRFVAERHAERWSYRWARWEPFFTAPLMKAARAFVSRGSGRGSARPTDDAGYAEFTREKKQVFRRSWAQKLWTALVLLEYLPQVWWRLGPSRLFQRRILCDRYLPDLWVDLAVNFDSGPEGVRELSRHPLCRLFPRIDRMVFLDVDPAVGCRRKCDGTPQAYLEERRPLYLALAEVLPFTAIGANGSIEEVSEALGKVLK